MGLFVVVFAIVVYAAMGERQAVTPIEPPIRLDPKAILESAGAAFQQFREARQDYVIEADQQLTYEGGATKFIGVTIKVRNRSGRDFVISGREAQAGENREEMAITGEVRLAASDGFTVTAESATFQEVDATVRVPGAVAFHKGRMAGSGTGMTYDQDAELLSLAQDARVAVTNDEGKVVTQFRSGAAVLARQDNLLTLEGNVHALRGDQVLEADRGIARLSDNDEIITFIELRGNARVVGGVAFESMSARDIDLDYTDDGATLERVALTGGGAIAMTVGEEAGGRRFFGDSLELAFAPDGSLTRVAGTGNVTMDLPGASGAPARSVKAEAFAGAGDAGKGLTAAQFTDQVEYREAAAAQRPPRLARANALRITLAGDVITGAAFTGSVRFEEQGLQAAAAHALYDPNKGTLRLSGAEAGRAPRVEDEHIQIEADVVGVTLDGPRVAASGNVRSILRPRASDAAAQSATTVKLPSLLQSGQPVNISADELDYRSGEKTVYSGSATLWQGETAIRADVLTLDQARADLVASGAARSNIVLDTGVSVGRAREIRYDDSARRISYNSPPPPAATGSVTPTIGVPTVPIPVRPAAASATPKTPTVAAPSGAPAAAPAEPTPPQPGPPVASAGTSQLIGPQGDLRAARIEVILAKTAAHAERLEAYTDVHARIDARIGTGDRLTYYADEGRYVMTGVATVPVKIVEECRETSGRTITFFKSTDRIIVDGNEEIRTLSRRGGACPPTTTP
jgi:lipopolysaccharide export system protein LptA